MSSEQDRRRHAEFLAVGFLSTDALDAGVVKATFSSHDRLIAAARAMANAVVHPEFQYKVGASTLCYLCHHWNPADDGHAVDCPMPPLEAALIAAVKDAREEAHDEPA